ncbi:hypothetical protein [Candidatus Enterococcus willemsii]|uniref:Uncharacterized protein n=1 Tax=Candidatus Enterococcus willemsii TaxID=1857215 RepID=A0ABQ6YX48_9ENTE|nr:hypothetical protein [Enterococcus sp. CU12B]KAF1302068.1 hypothetical protein BAU17_01475 [Enterococcus sp. CU12B]
MNEHWIDDALNADGQVKLIMKGTVEDNNDEKKGVVSIVYISEDKEKVRTMFHKLTESNKDDFFMIYSCDYDIKLDDLNHYPSIAIDKEDLE